MQYFGFDRPSFSFGTFGFGEVLPKLVANFTTGEYKASGEAKTFAEVFDFNRAGKAWLVKDTGLVEYAVDTPRFDDGLLIEKAATNLFPSSLSAADAYELKAATLVNNNEVKFTNTGRISLGYTTKIDSMVGKALCFSVYTSSTNIGANEYGSGSACAVLYNGQTSNGTSVSRQELSDGRFQFTRTTLGYIYTYLYPADSAAIEIYYSGSNASLKDIKFYQIETALRASSYVKTTGTPVTRPADFLQTKITGTIITGDWDSTLSLSIVDGQIVHSGYGRIRSLEIN